MACGTGAAFFILAGGAAAAVKIEVFVPGLFPRFVGSCSGAGDELCGLLYRSGSRSVFLFSVGEGEDEVLPVVPAGHRVSGVLVQTCWSVWTLA